MKTGCNISWLGLLIIAIVLFVASRIEAQDTEVHARFSPDCIVTLDTGYLIYFGYWADGEKAYTVTSDVSLSAPDTIVTSEGFHHAEWYAEGDGIVTFTAPDDEHTLSLVASNLSECESLPNPTPQPTAEDTCPAWSVNGNGGGMLCLWDLPRAGGWQ